MSTEDKYNIKGHKLYWHLSRVDDWVNGKRIAPVYLEIGITRNCNIACVYCDYGTHRNKDKTFIPLEDLVRFLNDAASIGVKGVGIFGDGEPMLHSGVYEAVAVGKKAGLDMAISTNGQIMKSNKLYEFLKNLTLIRFNISAANPKSYAEVMGVKAKDFYRVIENIKNCVEIKRKYNLNTTIGMQMVLTSKSINDIVPFGELGLELGVDYAGIKQCTKSHKDLKGEAFVKEEEYVVDFDSIEHLMEKAESYSNHEYSVIIKREKMKSKIKKYDHCYGCRFLLQVSGSGDVYTCSVFFGNPKFVLGNIRHESFKDIVFSERYNEVMNMIEKDIDVHKSCVVTCRQNEINEFLWKIKNPPSHVNFI